MNVLVTGGAGFIGRWVVKRLLDDGHKVWVIDNLSNGRRVNLEEFESHPNFVSFTEGDILDTQLVEKLFENGFDLCYHLAASINVQDSIDDPKTTFMNDTVGTFYILEECRKFKTKMVFMSTCMVYDRAKDGSAISENHPVKVASPYAGSKVAAENMVLSYWHTYGLPVTVVRPFNTYGPYQKSGGEGGVVPIFIKKKMNNETINIYGDGTQTRDLLYVEDCASFVVECGYSQMTNGEILNAGLGKDITINQLAELIANSKDQIKHVPHIHPQSEISKLCADYTKAKRLLNWEPKTDLIEGIKKTENWMSAHKMLL